MVVTRSTNGSAVSRCAVVNRGEPGIFTCLTFEVESCDSETTFVDLVIDSALASTMNGAPRRATLLRLVRTPGRFESEVTDTSAL